MSVGVGLFRTMSSFRVWVCAVSKRTCARTNNSHSVDISYVPPTVYTIHA